MQLPTPKTPRHRDALSKRVPITPRHKIGSLARPLTPHTPRTPSSPSIFSAVYYRARQLFTSSADPGPFVGREDERETLQIFLQKGITAKSGRCLYVSGPPGTGKSALVNEVFRGVQQFEGVKTAQINCMSAKRSEAIYGKLIEEFADDDCQFADGMARLRAMFMPKKKSPDLIYIVTLDEIDHLVTLDLEVLYTLFEWSLHPSSRLIIIGIANALDLTDRLLPRLKSRNLKPQLLPFLPYTAPQIASVITNKLHSILSADHAITSDFVPVIHPSAIQLCSKKVAAQSGDLRKAFDIVRKTVDLIETEIKQEPDPDQHEWPTPSKTIAGKTSNSQSRADSPLAKVTSFTAPRASITHVSRVASSVLSNGASQRLNTLNLQQQAVLCALISHQKKSRASTARSSVFTTPSKSCAAPPVRKIYETYRVLCREESDLNPVTSTEFMDVMSGLETLGLVGEEKGGRGFRMATSTPSRRMGGVGDEKRILCFVDEDEMKACLKGVGRALLIGLLACEA